MHRPSRLSLCSLVFVVGSVAAVHALAQAQAPVASRGERVAALLP
jgi:hypothetical protein